MERTIYRTPEELCDVDAYRYALPLELIAQNPADERDGSRLLRLSREDGSVAHGGFADLPGILRPGDMLVMNDTRVFKARLTGKKVVGSATVELLCLAPTEDPFVWRALVRPGRKLPPGSEVVLSCGFLVKIGERQEEGLRLVHLPRAISPWELFERCGQLPLPHYIKRTEASDDRYQTVYSDHASDRSVAAPTAGLHFTEELLQELRKSGVDHEFVTLDVGIGTFRPVKVQDVREHRMHHETCRICETAAERINARRERGGRIVAVGTTVVRTLESFADDGGRVGPGERNTDLFIRPGYAFRIIDALITNFHLPGSTLLMLVAAFAGYENVIRAYETAVREQYRFFSFGDAMLIE